MNSELRIVLSLSSVPAMLERVDALLELANAHSEHGALLAACAAVLLAATLDQGTKSVIASAAANRAADEGVPSSETVYDILFTAPLRKRIILLPEVLSDGKYRLNFDSEHSHILRELIDLRNKLMHVSEKPDVLTEYSPNVALDLEANTLKVDIALPSNPWLHVTLEQVRRFRATVELYVEEALFPESGQFRSGVIVLSA